MLMKIQFFSYSNCTERISVNCRPWYERHAVIAYANNYCDFMTRKWITTKWNFHHILTVNDKSWNGPLRYFLRYWGNCRSLIDYRVVIWRLFLDHRLIGRLDSRLWPNILSLKPFKRTLCGEKVSNIAWTYLKIWIALVAPKADNKWERHWGVWIWHFIYIFRA